MGKAFSDGGFSLRQNETTENRQRDGNQTMRSFREGHNHFLRVEQPEENTADVRCNLNRSLVDVCGIGNRAPIGAKS